MRGARGKGRALGRLGLAGLGLAVSALTPALAAAPYRAWQRGQVPQNVDGSLEEVRLPNGAVVLVKTGRNGNRYYAGEVMPGGLSVGSLAAFPQEKTFRENLAKGRYEPAGELLDKVLADPSHGSEIVAPPWAPWELPGWTSVESLARARLLALPSAGREAVRKLRDDEATPRFEVALEAGDAPELRRLLARYPVSAAAPRAAVAIGDLAFEAGDLPAALLGWERARRDYPADVDDASLEAKVARAHLLLRARPPRERPRRPRPAAAAALGALALPEAPPVRLLWRRRAAATTASVASPLPTLLVRGDGDTAYVHDEAGVHALELETGRLVWRTPLERAGVFAGDDAASTVVLGDQLALVRGRHLVFVLDRETGRVRTRLHAGRDFGAGADDHLDAVALVQDRIVVLASIGTERIAFGFDRTGALLWRTPLWAAGGLDASLATCGEGVYALADGGVAALAPSGSVRWIAPARPRVPGRSPERGLELRGDLLLCLDLHGILALDPGTGTAASQPDVAPDSLVLGVAPTGPVVLDTLPRTPGDSRPRLLGPGGPWGLVAIRRLEFDDRPAFPGAVAGGAVFFPTEQDLPRRPSQLVGFDLASGREVARVAIPGGPGRLAAASDVLLVSRDDEVLAFAARPLSPAVPPLPDAPAALAPLLGSPDWRVREQARARLRQLGTLATAALQALEGSPRASLEARESAAALLDATDVRGVWTAAFPALPGEHLERLLAARAEVRVRALLSLPLPPAPDAGAAAALARAFRRSAIHDPEPAMRAEALGRLLRYDEGARRAVFAVLETEPTPATAADLELARGAAATAIAASGAARPGAPGHEELERAVANGSEATRLFLYRSLLRHGGTFEGSVVARRARPGDVAPDPVAQRVLLAWSAHEEHDDPAALEDDSLETSQRRAHLDEERHALLARPELLSVLSEGSR